MRYMIGCYFATIKARKCQSIYSATIMYLIHARVVHILGASLSAGEQIDDYNHNCLPSCKTIALHTRSRIHGMINIINTAIMLYPKLSTSTCSTLLELLAEKQELKIRITAKLTYYYTHSRLKLAFTTANALQRYNWYHTDIPAARRCHGL